MAADHAPYHQTGARPNFGGAADFRSRSIHVILRSLKGRETAARDAGEGGQR